MARKIAKSNKEDSRKQITPATGYSTKTSNGLSFEWSGVITTIIFTFIIALAGSMDNVIEKWTALFSLIVILVLFFVFHKASGLKQYITPLFFSITAYIIWGGISTFYAASGKFAIFEFSKLLVAFCIYLVVLFFTSPDESGLKKISFVLALTGSFFGIISVDAASSGILSGIFKAVFGLFTKNFENNGAFEEGIRITGIFGNPNIYAGFMAVAVLVSLYLVIHASDKKESRIAGSLLAVNSLAYLLAFSLGSLFMFLIACLIMIGISERERRVSLFLLMAETAIITFVFAFLSMTGLGKNGAVSFIPVLALVLNAVFFNLIDGRARPVLNQKLNENSKYLFTAILIILILIAGYTAAAFTITNGLTLSQKDTVMRAIYVQGGEYTLNIESSDDVHINIESQNEYDLMRHTSSTLFSGTNETAIAFTVPDDSKIVLISFSSGENSTEIYSAQYQGLEEGRIDLNYPLLPGIIANRLQNLFANENMVQRTIFFEDGMKLFSKSPAIGRGLGGFENGVYSVQDFFYETKYAHNHYIQVLSDLGVIGFVLYLSILGSAVMAIIQSKRRSRSLYAVPVLSACVFQIFGQALTDATWSMGVSLGFIAVVLAAVTIFCAEPMKLKENAASGKFQKAEIIILTVFIGIFTVLLSGNLYAQAQAKSGVEGFDDIERLIVFDRFEYNDYKLSYIINAPDSKDEKVLEQADVYARELMEVESNSLAPYILAYNFETYKDYDAFEAAKNGIKNVRSYPHMWSRIFDVFEEYIDPVGAHTDDAADRLKDPKDYVDGVLEIYDALLERNKNSLDQIKLNPYNNAFVGKLLEIRATNLYSIDWVFTAIMTYAFDSECAADTDQNGIPDSMTVISGSIQRNSDGLLEVSDNTVIELNLYHELHGIYTFMVKTETPQGIQIEMGGEKQNVVYNDDEAAITVELPDNSEMNLTKFKVTFPSAAVIDSITYITELE